MDSTIEIAHGYGYLLYCIPVEKCLAVSCSVIVISVHDNSNTKEDQQEMREDWSASEWKNKEEAAKK